MKKIDGGVTAAKGFFAEGISAGIKKGGALDMAILISEKEAAVAGTFTSNVVKAAPVVYDRKIVREKKKAQAVIINSGVANACTGQKGLDICVETADAVAAYLNEYRADDVRYEGGDVPSDAVLVASTGVIGRQIPVEKIKEGADLLCQWAENSQKAGETAARAIMTTDTKKKEYAVSFTLSDGTECRIGGMSKGSGMIHPNMCTMLAFVTTDAAVDADLLQEALSADIRSTYNMISIDGDTSTNDTCLLFANGAAGNAPICEKGADFAVFCEALHAVNEGLAKQMAADGEGATALFEVLVNGAPCVEDARVLARSVVSSNLTKAAICGHDANWGRILCALGYSGIDFDPEKVDLTISSAAGELAIVRNGVATDYSEEKATEILSESAILITCDMHMGETSASAWGCDLTKEYVAINGDYRS